jgi:hypothetical protein
LDFQPIEQAAREVPDRLDQKRTRNIVLDFHQTDCHGTTTLAFFTKLRWVFTTAPSKSG